MNINLKILTFAWTTGNDSDFGYNYNLKFYSGGGWVNTSILRPSTICHEPGKANSLVNSTGPILYYVKLINLIDHEDMATKRV